MGFRTELRKEINADDKIFKKALSDSPLATKGCAIKTLSFFCSMSIE